MPTGITHRSGALGQETQMKIVVAGLPPAQSTAIVRDFPGHDLRLIGAQEGPSRYASHAAEGCDMCVVNTRLISHHKLDILRKKGIRITPVSGYSSAVRAIMAALGLTRRRTA